MAYSMIDTLFWYTGLIAWMFLVFGWGAMLWGRVQDRAVIRRARAAN